MDAAVGGGMPGSWSAFAGSGLDSTTGVGVDADAARPCASNGRAAAGGCDWGGAEVGLLAGAAIDGFSSMAASGATAAATTCVR